MSRHTPADILDVAEGLRSARDRSRPVSFLTGAGCSITAEIPNAADLIRLICEKYPKRCAKLIGDQRYSYGACMALLTINERRDLLRPFLENAKINWGTIALAQLIANGFVGRVFTVNFDLVLENACGLLGLRPAVYDFGIAPANDPDLVVSPSIIHLHGQSYGLVLLNTDDETRKHREKLQPILTASLRSAPLVVVGYSGSADGIVQILLDQFAGSERLYWLGYADDPAGHIKPLMEKEYSTYLGGADFDRFMIDLALALDCWPPQLFSRPLHHLLNELRPVVSYPVMDADNAIELLGDLRQRLQQWQHQTNEGPAGVLRELFMTGSFEKAADHFLSEINQYGSSDEDRDIAVWSLTISANELLKTARRTDSRMAKSLLKQAAKKYEMALGIKADFHAALSNWANCLMQQARLSEQPAEVTALLALAEAKYRKALTLKPDRLETLNNLGNLFYEQASRARGSDSIRLFKQAGEMYKSALRIKPDQQETLSNFGCLLMELSKSARGKNRDKLLSQARENLLTSKTINPKKTYNLACLAGLQGDEGECQLNLENASRCGTLPAIEHLQSNPDLDFIKDKSWFKELLEREVSRST